MEKIIEKSGNRKTLLLKKTDQHRTRVGAPGQLGMLVLAEGNPKDLNYFRSKIKGLQTIVSYRQKHSTGKNPQQYKRRIFPQ